MAILLTEEWQTLSTHQIGSNQWGKWTAYLQAKHGKQSEGVLVTPITARLQITVTGNGNYFTADDFETYINGVKNDMGKETFNKGTVTAQTLTFNVEHDEDGTYEGNITYRINTTFGTDKANTAIEVTVPAIEIANAIVMVDGVKKKAQVYVGVNGVPTKADVYVGVGGEPVKCSL